MALVRVRAKTPEGGTPSDRTTQVDETWLEAWPDDFELVPEPAPVAADPAAQPAAAPAAGTPEQPAQRGRF